MFHENLFKLGVAGLKVVTNGITLLDVVVLISNASDRDEKFTCTLAKIFSASSRGWPRSSNQVRNSSFCNSKISLTEFVLSKRKVSPLIKPFLTLKG